MSDSFNTGGCNGCKYHQKDSEETFWVYEDGSPRNDMCAHPHTIKTYGEPVPVFNVGCKRWVA